MKPFAIILIVLVIAIAGGAIWYFTQSKPATPEKAAAAPTPTQADTPKAVPPPPGSLAPAPKPSAPVAQVEKPVAPPAAQPVAVAAKPASTAEALTGDAARANPDTSVTEAIRLLEANDIATLFKEFAPPGMADDLPPGMSLDQMIQTMTQDPGMQKEMAKSLEALHSIQGQAPTLSHTDSPIPGPGGHSNEPALSDGDNTAIYQANLSDGTTKKIILKKTTDGLWYIDDM